MFKEKIESTFGPNALELGLFYTVEQALRFELSQSGSSITMFASAYDRAKKVCAKAFEGAEHIIVVGSYFGLSQKQLSHTVIRSFKDCTITINRPYECWSVLYDDSEPEEPLFRTFIAFKIKPEQLTDVLWGALGSDLGIEPCLLSKVHIAAPDIGILVYPYDDRGMDIIGSNTTRLKSLYSEFNPWLLDYDREQIDTIFREL